MSYLHLFLPSSSQKPVCNLRATCIEEDWKFIQEVFPEHGFRPYFLGFIISQLAKELKQNGITSYHQRAERPELADCARFLSNIHLIRETDNRDDGCRARGACDENEVGEGESTGAPVPASRETKEGESTEEGSSARLVLAGLSGVPLRELTDKKVIEYRDLIND